MQKFSVTRAYNALRDLAGGRKMRLEKNTEPDHEGLMANCPKKRAAKPSPNETLKHSRSLLPED